MFVCLRVRVSVTFLLVLVNKLHGYNQHLYLEWIWKCATVCVQGLHYLFFIGVVYIYISHAQLCMILIRPPLACRDEMVESLCVMAAGVCVYEGNQAG